MTLDCTKKTLRLRWRIALVGTTAIAIGAGANVAFGYDFPFGNGAIHALGAGLQGQEKDKSKFESLMHQAREALKENRPRLAVIFLKNAVAMESKNGEAHLQLGLALLAAGDSASAERELRAARQFGAPDQRVLPAIFQAMLMRSEGKRLLAQFPAPAEGDTSALASETLRARAIALRQTGKSKEAAAALDQALSFDRSAANLMARAQLARGMADTNLAMKLVDEALKKSPKDVSALVTKVDLLMQAKQDEKALAVSNDLVKFYPKSTEALMTRAGVYLQLHQHGKAMADINESLKAAPNMALGVYYKALAMEQAKETSKAWDLAQSLPQGFINSHAGIGTAVSQMAINAGHAEIGTSILSSTVSNFPNDVNARVRLAARYLQLKDAQRARETLQPMANSADPRIAVLLAQVYEMDHQYTKSIEYLEKAKTAGLGGAPLKHQIAIDNLRAGNLAVAVEELSKLNRASPGDVQTAGTLITALLQKGEYEEALNIAKSASSAAPKSPYGPLYEGRLLMRRGNLDGAVSSFSQAIERDKKFIPALYERAQALAARGDMKAADADLGTILAADPNNMLAQIKLAQFELQSGEKDKAETLLKRAASSHPKELWPSVVLTRFQMQQGHLDEAAAVIEKFLNQVPNDPSALAIHGEIQLASGKTQQALATFRNLASSHPKSAQIQLLLGATLAKSGNAKAAMSVYQNAVQIAPKLQATHLALIEFALASKNDGLALSTAQDYAEREPGTASANVLARTYTSLNRVGDAVNVLTKSEASHPNSDTLLFLTTLLRKRGDSQRADTLLTDWIGKHPEDSAVRMAYAGAQLANKPTTAEEQYRAVLKLQPYNLIALNNLGWLLQQKDPKEALPYCDRAAKLAPNSAGILDTLAWTKWLLNDKSEALVLLERAHANDSKNPEITYHLVVALDGNGRHGDAKKMLSELLASNQPFSDIAAAKALEARWQ